MVLDGLNVGFRKRAVECIDLRRADARALALTQELDALRRAVRALVELAGQRLDSKDGGSAARVDLPARQVELRLGENGICGIGKEGLVDALNVVAVPDAHAFETLEVQKRAAVGKKARALGRKAGLFFNTDAIDHLLSPFARRGLGGRCRCGSICWQNRPRTISGRPPSRLLPAWGRRR